MSKKIISELLDYADIKINGNNPWDIQIHNQKFYPRVLQQQTLGLGESYMEGWWDCHAVDHLIFKLLDVRLYKKFKITAPLLFNLLFSKIINQQSLSRSKKVAQLHYDLSYDLFSEMLGPSLSYTCAYFKNTTNLTLAQNQKHDLICQKLQLDSNDKILELGCGWGSFAKYAAENYGCHVTAVNISKEQINYAKNNIDNPNTHFHCCDWRESKVYNPNNDKFDKVVSIGMAEHVGYKNYNMWMKLVETQLKDYGLFLLHSIGSNVSTVNTDPWIAKYIFPNGMLPSVKQLSSAIEDRFILEDLHNFGADYDKTLMLWHKNFENSWPHLKENYSNEFYRMWRYYLLSCAGMFRARDAQLFQLVLSKKGIPGGYQSVR